MALAPGALQELGGRLTTPQVDALVRRLDDQDENVRREAAEALEKLGKRLTSSQVAPLEQLGSEDELMQELSYGALRQLYHKGILDRLSC
ncbi:MAG: HEAT repeat domain-containing protein [Pseudomonadota bacterium]|nr:HEAT repeat domain-containing protein [Pseudomonadota bacterium]